MPIRSVPVETVAPSHQLQQASVVPVIMIVKTEHITDWIEPCNRFLDTHRYLSFFRSRGQVKRELHRHRSCATLVPIYSDPVLAGLCQGGLILGYCRHAMERIERFSKS
jgi:hypothetical protein